MELNDTSGDTEWERQLEEHEELSQEMFWDESASFPKYEYEDEMYFSDDEPIWEQSPKVEEDTFISDLDYSEDELNESLQSLKEVLDRST